MISAEPCVNHTYLCPLFEMAVIDWISDTLSQGYTNLQSFWIIGVLHRIQYAVEQGGVGLRNLRSNLPREPEIVVHAPCAG